MIETKQMYDLRVMYEEDRARFGQLFRTLTVEQQSFIIDHWYFNKTPDGKLGTRLEQILPWHKDWRRAIWKPGRRWGKTFAAANNVIDSMIGIPGIGWIAVAASFGDCKTIMFEGPSGLIAALTKRGYTEHDGNSRDDVPIGTFIYTSSGKPTIKLDNGSNITGYSAEKASKLRGQGKSAVWLDEIFTYFEEEDIRIRNHKINQIWMQAITILSEADTPRMLITSTPTPVDLLKKLYSDMEKRPEIYIYVLGALLDNPWLSDEFKEEAILELSGTAAGRAELYGEECWDIPGALWQREDIKYVDDLEGIDVVRTVVAIDPAVSNNKNSDETGIVVVAKCANKKYYVLRDASIKGTPKAWAERAVALYDEYQADRIIYESNQGGDLVAETLMHVRRSVPTKGVRASKGKYARAEPIAALYEQGKVFHVGMHNELEDQLCSYNPEFYKGSPDRLDALVWGLHELSTMGEYKITRF